MILRTSQGLFRILFALAAATALFAGAPATASADPAQSPPCEGKTFEGSTFTVCTFRPDSMELRLDWTGADGQPLEGFAALGRLLGAKTHRLRFSMNAGMYDLANKPVGLFIENGSVRVPAQTGSGAGNFYLKPNGVFSVDRDGGVFVETTESFAARHASPLWATQSGPMLVMGGKLHPSIQNDGVSRLIRNGVGRRDAMTAVFVISDTPVSFGRLARFFRDDLGCADALFLDGSVSSLWAPALNRRNQFYRLGPMATVLDKP
jgi:uncharacterized protein YigE (DUF2233 family)